VRAGNVRAAAPAPQVGESIAGSHAPPALPAVARASLRGWPNARVQPTRHRVAVVVGGKRIVCGVVRLTRALGSCSWRRHVPPPDPADNNAHRECRGPRVLAASGVSAASRSAASVRFTPTRAPSLSPRRASLWPALPPPNPQRRPARCGVRPPPTHARPDVIASTWPHITPSSVATSINKCRENGSSRRMGGGGLDDPFSRHYPPCAADDGVMRVPCARVGSGGVARGDAPRRRVGETCSRKCSCDVRQTVQRPAVWAARMPRHGTESAEREIRRTRSVALPRSTARPGAK
jgi:hypothetical protein